MEVIKKDDGNSEQERLNLESILSQNNDSQTCHLEEPSSLISFETIEAPAQTDIIRQPWPPPVLAEVQYLIPTVSPHLTEAERKTENPSLDGFVQAESPLQLHISTTMMENFRKLAKSNTDKNLETCGVLAGSLTHPTQSCFMSSIDLHTHYSYQIMLPEAVAIVMAPKDNFRNHIIFWLTTPGGMSVIRKCQQLGFHPHDQPSDSGPIYNTCTDVYMNPNLKFDVIDPRWLHLMFLQLTMYQLNCSYTLHVRL